MTQEMAWQELRAKLLLPITDLHAKECEVDTRVVGSRTRLVNYLISYHMPVIGLVYLKDINEFLRGKFGSESLKLLSYCLKELGLTSRYDIHKIYDHSKDNFNHAELKNGIETDFLPKLKSLYGAFGFEIINVDAGEKFSVLQTSHSVFKKKYIEFSQSDKFLELQVVLGEFFDSHKDFFIAAALGKFPAERTLNKAASASEIFNYDWLKEQIPNNLKEDKSSTFMKEFLADPQLKEDLDELAAKFNLAANVKQKIISKSNELVFGAFCGEQKLLNNMDGGALSALNYAWVRAQMPKQIGVLLSDVAQSHICRSVCATDIDALSTSSSTLSLRSLIASSLSSRIQSK